MRTKKIVHQIPTKKDVLGESLFWIKKRRKNFYRCYIEFKSKDKFWDSKEYVNPGLWQLWAIKDIKQDSYGVYELTIKVL